jgi:hypothetical protein
MTRSVLLATAVQSDGTPAEYVQLPTHAVVPFSSDRFAFVVVHVGVIRSKGTLGSAHWRFGPERRYAKRPREGRDVGSLESDVVGV